jgi:hypothetical protein
MSDNSFDALSKMAAKATTRRQTLRGLAAVLGGALVATLGGSRALAAAPQLCCVCGVGRPCNPKNCVSTHGFPGGTTCQDICGKKGVCDQFHCPSGCPS